MPEFERIYVKVVGESDLDRTLARDTRALGRFQKSLDGMFKKFGNRKIDVEVEESGAAATSAAIKGVGRDADRLDGTKAEVNVGVDTSGFMRGVSKVRSAIASLPRRHDIDLGLDTGSIARGAASVRAAMAAIPSQKEVNVDVDVGGAIAKLGILKAATMGSGSLVEGFNVLVKTGRNAFAVAIPAAIAASVAALQPLIGGLGIAASAGASLAAGFGLVAGPLAAVVSRLGEYHESLDKVSTAQSTAESSSKALADSQRGIADARANVDRVAAEGARNIAEQEQALKQVRADGAAAIAEEERTLAEVRRQGAEEIQAQERQLQQVREDGAEAVQAEERALVEVRRNSAREIADQERQLQQIRQDGARAVADQERALADARRQAAESTGQAEADLESARETLASATRSLTAAQLELNQAERDERFSQERATLDLASARDRATDALHAYNDAVDEYGVGSEEAADAQRDLRYAELDLQEQQRETNRTRREGSDELNNAKDAAKSAKEEQVEAAQGVREAEQNLIDARVEGARAVAEQERLLARLRRDQTAAIKEQERVLRQTRADAARAEQEQIRSIVQAREDAAEAITEQERAVRAARADAARAEREQLRAVASARKDAAQQEMAAEQSLADTRRQAAQQSADANRALKDAMRNAADAADDLAEAQAKVAEETIKLTPAQQRLYDKFMKFRGLANKAFGGAQDAVADLGVKVLDVAEDMLPRLGEASEKTIGAVSGAFDDIVKKLSKPVQIKSFDKFLDAVPAITGDFVRAAGNFAGGIFNLLAEATPYAKDLANWIEDISEDFLKWTQSKEGRKAMRKFFDSAAEWAPVIAEAIGDMAKWLGKISEMTIEPLSKILDVDKKDNKNWSFEVGEQIGEGIRDGISSWFKGDGSIWGLLKGAFNLLNPYDLGIGLARGIFKGLSGGNWKEKGGELLGDFAEGAKNVWARLDIGYEGSALQKLVQKVNNIEFHPFKSLKKAWDALDIGWKGSDLQKLYQKIADGAKNAKGDAGERFRELKANLGNIWNDTWKLGGKWWDRIANKIGLKSEEGKKKAGDNNRNLWENLKNIWGDTWKLAGNWWDKIANKIDLKSEEGKKKGGDNNRSLWENLKNIWDDTWKSAGNWWDKIADKISSKSEEAKSKGGESQRNLFENAKNIWKDVFENARERWDDISSAVRERAWDIKRGVTGAWDALWGFVKNILDKLGLNVKDASKPSVGKKTAGENGRGGAQGLAARGGVYTHVGDSGGINWMARGGQGPIGGLATRGPRVVYGEAGPEAYVTLGRYTPESANALRMANETWSRKGWLERAERFQGDLADMNPGGRRGQGEGLGPTLPDSHLVGPVLSAAKDISRRTGTSFNTYVGHGEPGGSISSYTADFWGPGGRGSPIAKSAGYKTADIALDEYNSNPAILYIIRQGKYWRGGNWSGNTYGDPHYDHTHISWDSPGGAKASGGGTSGPSWQETAFEKGWDLTAQPIIDRVVDSMQGGFVLRPAAGALTAKAGTAIHDKILAWIQDKFGGSGAAGSFTGDWATAAGGGPSTNMAIGEAAAKELGWSSQWSAWKELGNRESGWDRKAKNPSSGAYGIPQALPESKLPAAGQSSGGSNAGPQVGWMADYMKERYGDPKGALAFHDRNNWYGRGGVIPGPAGMPVLIQAHAGERVLPQEVVRGFDRLAHSIEIWSKRHPSRGGGEPERADDRVERAIREMREEIADELRDQKRKMLDAEELLHMALRVQDSPAGQAGHVRRTKRMINREMSKIGGR